MWNLLNLDCIHNLLAQCSCNGGSERRISFTAVVIAAAVVLLGGFLHDRYARRKSRALDLLEGADSREEQANHVARQAASCR